MTNENILSFWDEKKPQRNPDLGVIKLFLSSTQLRTKNFNCSYKLKYRQMKKFLALSLLDVVFIMLINVKMPTIVGILTFMSTINVMLSWVEHEKSFITSGPSLQIGECN